MVLGARTLLPMLLTISLQACSRQHLNYFKPSHPFLTHISSPASNLWQGCENRSVRTTAALFLDSDKQPSTWNPLKMANFIFFMFSFKKFRSYSIDCVLSPCSDRLELCLKRAPGRMWEYCLVISKRVHMSLGPPANGPNKEVVNGCDFPNSGLGTRQRGLWNNSASLGWATVSTDLLGFRSQELQLRVPISCPITGLSHIPQVKILAWTQLTAHSKNMIFICYIGCSDGCGGWCWGSGQQSPLWMTL